MVYRLVVISSLPLIIYFRHMPTAKAFNFLPIFQFLDTNISVKQFSPFSLQPDMTFRQRNELSFFHFLNIHNFVNDLSVQHKGRFLVLKDTNFNFIPLPFGFFYTKLGKHAFSSCVDLTIWIPATFFASILSLYLVILDQN